MSKNQVLNFIKETVASGDYESVLNINSLVKKSKLQQLKFPALNDIEQRFVGTFTDDLKKEVYWLLFNIINEADSINGFLIKKNLFEKKFLLCNYDAAKQLHTEIEDEYGVSLWSIEMSLLLKENVYDTKENWSCLSDYLSQIKSPFYKFIINFYSKRIEENMSFDNCFTQFQNDFDGIVASQTVRDFLVFKNVFIADFEYSFPNFEAVLHISNLFGSIDQYLVLVEVLLKLFAKDRENDKLISVVAKKLSSKITADQRIFQIIDSYEMKPNEVDFPLTVKMLPAIDSYTKSNFDECLNQCQEMFTDNPSSFELFELYCKSLINLNKEFVEIGISKNVDTILKAIYHSLLFDNSSISSRNKLLKYSLTFISFDFGKQLHAFAMNIIRSPLADHTSVIGYLSSSISNPRLFSISGKSNLQQTKDRFADHISVKANKLIGGDSRYVEEFSGGTSLQFDIYLSKHYFKNAEYAKVIEILEPYKQKTIPIFYYDIVLHLLFDSYINTDLLLKAIDLSAEILSNDELHISAFNIPILIEKIKDNGLSNFSHLIETPIIFSTVFKDYDLYEVYIDFMLHYDEEYPSRLDLNALFNSFSKDKVVYFLREVCTISTIRYSLEFSSIEKAEQERYEICTSLKKIDEKHDYDAEMSDILKAGAVRKAIKEVDEGRLYVNIESLKGLQLNSVKESFNRYKEIESASKDKQLIGFNASKDRDWINPDFQNTDLNPELSHPAFLAFKSIYLETREKFLFSKEYGLESCLSARIRHGTMKNLLRSVFEKLNIVTSKSGDKYLDNVRWKELIGYNHWLNNQVQDIMKDLSRDIDSLTTYIVDSLIQIQTEKQTEKAEGLFNYSINDFILMDFFNAQKAYFNNYSSLISRIYLELATATSIHIEPYIKNVLKTDINERFQYLIDGAQVKLRALNERILLNELTANLSKSSTDIQSELDNVAEWFTFNTSDSSSLLDLKTLITAGVEYTNKLNPNFAIHPEITSEIDIELISSSTMLFVFHILFDNIIKHSKLPASEIDVKIIVKNVDQFIEIKTENAIAEEVDIEEVTARLQIVKDNWNNNESIERSNIEGRSGFDKIKRILLYEAIAKTDRFEFSVSKAEVSISLFLPFLSQ